MKKFKFFYVNENNDTKYICVWAKNKKDAEKTMLEDYGNFEYTPKGY